MQGARSRRWLGGLAVVLTAVLGARVQAASIVYQLDMSGAKEPDNSGNLGVGDPDGTATGTLTVDDATGVISWDFTYANIAAPSAMHIHGPTSGPFPPERTNAGVFVGLGVAGDPGTSRLFGTLTTSTANALAINTNPGLFYVNIHNEQFLSGAVRDQLTPEPAAGLLLGLGAVGLIARRASARKGAVRSAGLVAR